MAASTKPSRTDAEGAEPDRPSAPPKATGKGPLVDRLLTPSGLTFLVLAAFVVIGGIARLSSLGQGSLWVDEAQSTLYSLSVLQHGYPVILSQHVINNWEPLYPYLEAFSILLLGHSNFAYRLPSALIGIALIPLAYLLGARLRDRYVGLTLAAMVAFSSEYIAWSRQARWYMLFVFLMALGFLALLLWDQASSRRARSVYLLGAAAATVGVALCSIGMFLVYLPGILAGALAFAVVVRWSSIVRFFRGPGPTEPVTSGSSHARIPYRYRPWIALLVVLAVVVTALVEFQRLRAIVTAVLTRFFGFAPYSVVWSSNLGAYLVNYYLPIVVLAFASVYFIARRRNPFEIGLLVCAAVSFASVSVGASITSNIAGGAGSYPRHLVPLLFQLFTLSALSIVGLVRWVVGALELRVPTARQLRKATPVLYAAAIVAMLVVPSALVPPQNTVYTFPAESTANSLVPWVPFSLDPQYPSALYETLEADYQLAAEYVVAHRAPGDVIGATNPGPVQVYTGQVQYWIRGNAYPTTIIYPGGRPAFYQTGSWLVANVTQLEGLIYNSSGWLVSDAPYGAGPPFPNGMDLVVQYWMPKVAAGSDPTIGLFHWNQSTPSQLVQMLIARNPVLNASIGNDTLSDQLGWAVTSGVTIPGTRSILVPVAPYLLPLISNTSTRALGVLFNVYNHRTDLQSMFPEVLALPGNDTGLEAWACDVASGSIPDPSYSVLAPYESEYCG